MKQNSGATSFIYKLYIYIYIYTSICMLPCVCSPSDTHRHRHNVIQNYRFIPHVTLLSTVLRFGVRPPGGGEIFHTNPDRPRGPPNLLYSGYRGSFPGAKQLGRGVNQPPASIAVVKERIELYFYNLSVLSWHVIAWTLQLRSFYTFQTSGVVNQMGYQTTESHIYYNTSDTHTNNGDAHTTKFYNLDPSEGTL
jgi:hypothetical protein